MLLAKLCLVPAFFLLLISLASRLWGPIIGGWLAGLPIVAGPILYILAQTEGSDFAVQASKLALAAIAASEAFNFAYALSCRRLTWPGCIILGLMVWLVVAMGLRQLPPTTLIALLVAAIAISISWLCLPRAEEPSTRLTHGFKRDLIFRMLAGTGLTLFVTSVAQALGPNWSGILSVFPLLGVILCASCHRNNGPDFTINLIRGMIFGRLSFAAFCLSLIFGLAEHSINKSFAAAALISLATQSTVAPLIKRIGKDRKRLAMLKDIT